MEVNVVVGTAQATLITKLEKGDSTDGTGLLIQPGQFLCRLPNLELLSESTR